MGHRIQVLFAAALALTLGLEEARAADLSKPSVEFNRLAEKLPAGLEWVAIQEGLLCVTKRKAKADGVLKAADMKIYYPLFAREFATAGYRDGDARPNLFETADASSDLPADYQIGGLVHHMDLKVCTWGFTDIYNVKGSATLSIQWQVYSPEQKKVVETIETTGAYTLKTRNGDLDPTPQLIQEAFADNVRQLAKSPQMTALMNAPMQRAGTSVSEVSRTRIALAGAAPASRPISEVAGAVVVVVTSTGHGSGVLISKDGYVLTNHHVIEGDRHVRVRWSDGFETAGEVIRSHKGRDVALIKTDPRDRSPLPVRTIAPQPGETVLAIGAPLDKQLQGTVTRGVMSANRVLFGYNFIQSDVMVSPGNSGGPLVDEKGLVIGLTDIGLRPEGVPAGLNFFIPIKEALEFLALDLSAPLAPAGPPARSAAAPRTGNRASAR